MIISMLGKGEDAVGGRRKQKVVCDRGKPPRSLFSTSFIFFTTYFGSLLLFNKAVERFLLGRMGWGRKERYPDKGVYGLGPF